MTDKPPDYAVGYKKPPLHSRFRKGRSGNPTGGPRAKRLTAVLEAALDRPAAGQGSGRKRPITQREAIVASLIEKSAAGDLRATKLLLDLVQKTELAAAPPPGRDDDDPRVFLLRELGQLAAAGAAIGEAAPDSVTRAASDE